MIAKNAATALINFANDPAYLKSMIQKNVISRLLDGILVGYISLLSDLDLITIFHLGTS